MLSAPLLYLLKANAVLLLFAAGYFGLLRRLTFFELNRAYLAFALLFAAVYPALPMPALWPAAAPGPVVAWVFTELPAGAPAAPRPAAVDWPALLLAGYAAGAAVLLGRLLVQLLSLARLHRSARPAVAPGGVLYRQLRAPAGPFSFGRTIYLHPGRHPAAELAAVLAHEQAHVRQGHTLDVLLAHVGTALFWANPAAWLLRRALLDNLEYLADAATLRAGLDRRAYQYSLLRLGPTVGSPALVSPFSFLTLKNRVLMMNRPASARLQLLRYLLAGSLVVAAALGFSGAPAPAPVNTPNKSIPADAIQYLDGKRVDAATVNALSPKKFERVSVLKGADARALSGKATGGMVILITTKAKANSQEVQDFNKKYGRVAPAQGPQAAISNVAAPALAYITKNYPDARITGVTAVKNAKTGTPNFRVEIAVGRRPQYLVFDERGQLVTE